MPIDGSPPGGVPVDVTRGWRAGGITLYDVTVLFLEGSHASTSIGPLEVFEAAGSLFPFFTAADPKPLFRVQTASIGGDAVHAAGAYSIQPTNDIADIERTDLVFVPSGGADLDLLLARNAPIADFLRRVHEEGAHIAGVCSGVSLLAASGILDGRPATTHWGLVGECRKRFPDVDWQPDELVTESDGVFCGAGVYASLDLALYLVEKIADHRVAVECAKALLIEMPRECQAGFAVLPMGTRHADDAIKRAETWIHGHCREDFSFEWLARELGMSPRNFIRRFKGATGIAPLEYIQRLRVRAAQHLLEGDQIRVQEIGSAVGYDDAAFFRTLFKRHTGLAPSDYRRRFASGIKAPNAREDHARAR